MKTDLIEISIRGKKTRVPWTRIGDKIVVVVGKWIRMAMIYDEMWLEGDTLTDPELLVAKLKEQKLKADVFTFSQKPPETEPKYRYHTEFDNVAVTPTASFADWWEKRIPQESRKNARRANRRGVIVKSVEFDDEFIRGITDIYNESPIRQGRPFWHYGKDFNTVKMENTTFLDRSEFIGAYYGSELIGFIKMVYVGQVANIMQVVSKVEHRDKRPTNALIAKAVEICDKKKISYLVYGKYTYGNKNKDPLMEFKQRNGFERMFIPKYYIPLTLKGRMIIKLKLHLGLPVILPANWMASLLYLRSKLFQSVMLPLSRPGKSGDPRHGEKVKDGRSETDS